tara:strand:- start:234 stop:617 length:384 start_codon:yes stop_codon:yes gene_type:complete
MDKIPPYYLSPPAIPIVLANPIQYIYIIFSRAFCCYELCFTIERKRENWKITIPTHTKAYSIPPIKTNNDISLIIQSLGISKRNIFKLEIWNGETLLKTHIYSDLHKIIKKIVDNQNIICDVCYGEM